MAIHSSRVPLSELPLSLFSVASSSSSSNSNTSTSPEPCKTSSFPFRSNSDPPTSLRPNRNRFKSSEPDSISIISKNQRPINERGEREQEAMVLDAETKAHMETQNASKSRNVNANGKAKVREGKAQLQRDQDEEEDSKSQLLVGNTNSGGNMEVDPDPDSTLNASEFARSSSPSGYHVSETIERVGDGAKRDGSLMKSSTTSKSSPSGNSKSKSKSKSSPIKFASIKSSPPTSNQITKPPSAIFEIYQDSSEITESVLKGLNPFLKTDDEFIIEVHRNEKEISNGKGKGKATEEEVEEDETIGDENSKPSPEFWGKKKVSTSLSKIKSSSAPVSRTHSGSSSPIKEKTLISPKKRGTGGRLSLLTGFEGDGIKGVKDFEEDQEVGDEEVENSKLNGRKREDIEREELGLGLGSKSQTKDGDELTVGIETRSQKKRKVTD